MAERTIVARCGRYRRGSGPAQWRGTNVDDVRRLEEAGVERVLPSGLVARDSLARCAEFTKPSCRSSGELINQLSSSARGLAVIGRNHSLC
jgi:hypothetical protein